jgi:hypothetical protein
MTAMLEDIVSHLRFSDSQNATVSSIADKMLESYYKSIGDWHPDKNEDREEKPKTVEGRDVFKYIYEDRENYNLLSYINREELLQLTSEAQDMCFDGTLDHYFRYLYRILKHIDESDLLNKLENPKKEREYYAHVLRAQLSNYELLMLFYNGLIGENPQTIKKLIEKYAISFEETCIRNDVRYSYLVGHYAKYIIVDSRQLYCVTTRKGSVSRGVGYKASMDELKVFAGWKKFFLDNKIRLDLPKFDFRAYNFSRHSYKNPKLFRKEYSILREAGFSHIYIIKLIIIYLYKSVGYKLS